MLMMRACQGLENLLMLIMRSCWVLRVVCSCTGDGCLLGLGGGLLMLMMRACQGLGKLLMLMVRSCWVLRVVCSCR